MYIFNIIMSHHYIKSNRKRVTRHQKRKLAKDHNKCPLKKLSNNSIGIIASYFYIYELPNFVNVSKRYRKIVRETYPATTINTTNDDNYNYYKLIENVKIIKKSKMLFWGGQGFSGKSYLLDHMERMYTNYTDSIKQRRMTDDELIELKEKKLSNTYLKKFYKDKRIRVKKEKYKDQLQSQDKKHKDIKKHNKRFTNLTKKKINRQNKLNRKVLKKCICRIKE